MAVAAAKSRMLDLARLQCSLFSTTFNPNRQRLGNKILRQRLKGPQLAAYYPRKAIAYPDMAEELQKRGFETWDEDQEYRLGNIQFTKLRGKGPPKKKRTADTSSKRKKK